MGVLVLVGAVLSLAALLFLLIESLKSQFPLCGRRVFVLSVVLGAAVGTLLALARLPGLGTELLPALAPGPAGLFLGVLAGLIAPAYREIQKAAHEVRLTAAREGGSATAIPPPAPPAPPPPPARATYRPIRPDEMEDHP